ncbi:pentatricopeptide repeat-containing protein [Fagus crenata]
MTYHYLRHSHKLSFHSSTSPPHLLQSVPHSQLRTKSHQFANLLQLQIPLSHNPILYYQTIHAQLIVSGCHKLLFLANILLRSYSKSGRLGDARMVFDVMSQRNLISWSTLVSMYTQHGYSEQALIVFSEFLMSCDENPNEYILASAIRACTHLGGVYHGAQLHCFVVKTGFEQDVYVGTSLIDFYAKNGDMDEARLVFDVLVEKTAVTWTTIITGYTKSGRGEVSLQLFEQMRETDVVPDKYVLSSVLSACSMLEFLEGGKQIHAYVMRRGTEMDVSVTNVLIDFYAKCGKVCTAQNLFDQMVAKNIISWTTMIAGYMQNSFNMEAMKLFAEMDRLGWKADGFACTSVLTSCGSLEALELGRQVHAYTIKANLEYDNFVKNGLVDMYAKCDSLTDARRVFDGMADHNVVSYNAMIEGYSSEEKLYEAVELFHEMRLRLIPPSLLTFVSLLGASAALLTLELSKQIHNLIIKYGVSLDVFAGSALIDVYSKCSCIRDARLVFEEINGKDIVVWNAMFFGYTQQLENEEALKLYSELQLSRQIPNEFTFAALITAASNLASLQHGQQLHNQVIKMGVDSDPFVTNSLITLEELEILDKLHHEPNQGMCPHLQLAKKEANSCPSFRILDGLLEKIWEYLDSHIHKA